MRDKGISVIICCFNSSERITEVFDFISKQNFIKRLSFEIVVIDNASTDRTSEIVELMMHKHRGISINLLVESRPGLMHAREKGINAAKFEYLLFCDDDNLLCDRYVNGMYDIMESDDQIGVCGGMGVELIRGVDVPNWFGKYKKSFAVGSQISSPQLGLYGAGMCVRYSALVKIYNAGFVSYLSGRKGDNLLAGDDGELVLAILVAGYKVLAVDELYFYHLLPKNRLTEEYLIRLYAGFGMMYPVIKVYKLHLKGCRRPTIARFYLTVISDIVKSFVYAIISKGLHKRVFWSYSIGMLRGIYFFKGDIINISKIVQSIHRSK